MQEPTTLAEGALLAGRYRVVRELGRGGSGRVLLAHDLRTLGVDDQPAERALKLVGREREAELRLELDVLRRLSHPCLAAVYELVTVDRRAGLSALVSELASGRPAHVVARELQARTRSRVLAEELPALVLRVAHDVASALAVLHARGLAHGDVKPDNIVVRNDLGACKLVDLGLVTPLVASADGNASGLSGTLGYLAPECFRGERSAGSDLYALGVTLFALLRGAPDAASSPSHGTHDVARYLRDSLRPLAEREPLPEGTPAELAKLIAHLLEPRAAQRASSAREVVASVLSLAHRLSIDLGVSVGGGVDDVATAAERAASVQALPLVGHAEALAQLREALSAGRVCALIGPNGSGRSRLAREAIAALQLEHVARGTIAPSYWAAQRLPDGALSAATCVHVLQAGDVMLASALAFAESARVDGTFGGLVLEREQPFLSGELAPGAVEIKVAPLREGEVRKLLEHALPGSAVPNALVQSALAVSGGLSGRLCRMLAHALAEGVAIERPGAFRAAASALSVDATDDEERASWPESSRALAELLSVAGGEVELAWLDKLDGHAQAARALRELGVLSVIGDRLVLRADVSHALLTALPIERRRALARQLDGAALDARASAFVTWAQAKDGGEAAFASAVERARRDGEPERAASWAREGRGLLESEPGREAKSAMRALLLAEADALRAAGRYAQAMACLDGAPDALGSPLASPRGALLRAEIARLAGASDREAHSDRARGIASKHGDDAVLAELDALDARLALDRGELSNATVLAERALKSAAPSAELRGCEVLALIALAQGDHGSANARVVSALARARDEKLVAAEARLCSIHAQVARALGDGSVAQRFARAVELADAAGERHAGATFLHNLGIERLEQGQLGAASVALREAARRLARLGRDADLARALLNVGLCAQLSGAVDNALDAAQRAHELALRAEDPVTLAHAICLRAELQLERGERRAALASLDALPAYDLLPPLTAGSVAARAAAMHAQLGDLERAALLIQQAERAHAADEHPALVLELALAQCRLAREHGQGTSALQAAERARAAALRAGSFDARLRATLASASAARSLGDSALCGLRLSEARALLDEAAQTLPPTARAAFRALPAYSAALEAAPVRPSVAAQPSRESTLDPRIARLLELAKRFASERRATRLHDLVLDAAVELTGAERGYLVLQDRAGMPRARAVRGLPNAASWPDQLAHSRSIVARVLATGRALSTVDAAQDESLSSAASVHQLALRSVLAVPLRLQGELRGALYLEDRQRPFAFGDAETALLTDLAELAGHALDNLALVAAERRSRMRLEIARARLSRTVQVQAAELSSLRTSEEVSSAHGIIAASPRMQRAVALGLKVASSDLAVLIRGESGTGKELMARAIHGASPRKSAPFVSENCGAIPEPLLESTLFGHVKGAFTGADRRRHGLFELADGGTLLLDEIGEMTPSMQVRLLRVLQDGEVRPVGSERSRRVDVRVLAATHRDLEAMVRDGRFREDLYYRLSVVTVDIPPLRERPEDLAPLVEAFIAKHAVGRNLRMDPATLDALSRCRFPGNVRQLENEMRRAIALCGDTIRLEHFSSGLFGGGEAAADPLDLRAQVDELERRLIRKALDESAGNQTRAARLLGISRFGLQKMMRRLGSVDLAS